LGRKSPKLNDKGVAVVALLKYIKQQSGKTLVTLESEWTPKIPKNDDSKEGRSDNHGGRQWSRWILGNAQPKIKVITDLYNYACKQLVLGKWKENGNESQWGELLPAVIDPKLYFLADKSKKLTLLKILEQIENSLVTTRMVRGIEAGYYIPSADDLRKIFWSKPSKKETDDDNEYVPWHRILPENDVEKAEMELLMTDILVNLGMSVEDLTSLEKYAKTWGLAGNDPASWSVQIHQQTQRDAQALSEICNRLKFLYPYQFKWTDDLDDESAKIAKKNHIKLHEYVAIADKKFKDYAETIDSASKSSSLMFGFFSKLSNVHFLSNGCEHRIGWSYPAIEIM